jgi:hypothetical protein
MFMKKKERECVFTRGLWYFFDDGYKKHMFGEELRSTTTEEYLAILKYIKDNPKK